VQVVRQSLVEHAQNVEVVVRLMAERIDMQHDHVQIAVLDYDPPGAEAVPARQRADGLWELLKSPLYATQVAAGDVLRVLHAGDGTFEIEKRGGNLCIQFYLAPDQVDCEATTAQAQKLLGSELRPLGGRIDGRTTGLVSCTVPVSVGFGVIEALFNGAAASFSGAQWQYGNVYHPESGEPLGWWNVE
jgi:uncharacterized protein DUF4265